jgi:hypothetical protein
MGKATLWISVVAASLAVFVLLHGASCRGRDWFYAAAGACLVALTNLAFVNVGLSGGDRLSGLSNREAGCVLRRVLRRGRSPGRIFSKDLFTRRFAPRGCAALLHDDINGYSASNRTETKNIGVKSMSGLLRDWVGKPM